MLGRDRFRGGESTWSLEDAEAGTFARGGAGGGRGGEEDVDEDEGESKCVSSDLNASASTGSLWSTTAETSVCKKLRALIGGTSSHISRNLEFRYCQNKFVSKWKYDLLLLSYQICCPTDDLF